MKIDDLGIPGYHYFWKPSISISYKKVLFFSPAFEALSGHDRCSVHG